MTKFWDWFAQIEPQLGNRKKSYAKIFEYLDKFDRPVTIIETGCARKNNDYTGDGNSTVIFDHYVQDRGGRVLSVDLNPDAVKRCRSFVSKQVKVHHGDSIKFLKGLKKISPDLVYLDSLDYMSNEPFLTSLHCANEFQAIRPIIRPDTLVVADDTPGVFIKSVIPQIEIQGKGAFLVQHADAVGATTLFHTWQAGWINMVEGKTESYDVAVDQLIGRARKHVENDRGLEAAKLYRAVLAKTLPPKSSIERVARGEACAFFARVAASVHAYGTAVDWYRDAVNADPRAVDYRLELVIKGYRPLLNWQLARQEAMRATLIEPDNQHAWRILGDVEMALCDVKRAGNAYDKQLEIAPDDANAMLDRCVISLDVADYALTEQLAEKVMQTDRRADGIHVMAMIANRQGRHEDAIELFDQAIAAGCNNIHTAHWNKSLSLHSIGRLREGWIEHEHRQYELSNPALSLPFQRFIAPLWQGQPAPSSIHVHAEAGMGDNICCSRFLKTLADRGHEVRYEIHKELIDLMRRSFPNVTVVERAPDYPGAIGLKSFDYHLPIGSMPYALETDIDSIPWHGPYLKADKSLAANYRKRLGNKFKVGVCWSSGIREYGVWLAEYGKRKSMHFDTFSPIFDVDGVQFVSLQVGPERQQNDGSALDILPETPSWDDTAALVECLDLVITVDTGVAHLAGAMGKPLWILMQKDGASWHFMCERPGASWNTRSPWYPSAKLFRQHEFNRPHFWDEVVGDVVRKLRNEIELAA